MANVITKNKKMIGAIGTGLSGAMFLGMDLTSGIMESIANISPLISLAIGGVLVYVAYLTWSGKR